MVPTQMILLPLFTIYFQHRLTGTLWPLILTYTATGLPLTVFMMATFFRAVPREIFEAATLDGASMYRTFWSRRLPLVRNALFTVGLVQFFFLWNDLLIALTFTTEQRPPHHPGRPAQLHRPIRRGPVRARPSPPSASACSAPSLIYLFLNQQVMKGLTAGSVKG